MKKILFALACVAFVTIALLTDFGTLDSNATSPSGQPTTFNIGPAKKKDVMFASTQVDNG